MSALDHTIRLGQHIFTGRDVSNQMYLWTNQDDEALGWSSWELSGFDSDGQPFRLEHTHDIELHRGEPDPTRGYWLVGADRPESIDVNADGHVSRIIGFGPPGSAPMPVARPGDGVPDIEVWYETDYDGDPVMVAGSEQVDAMRWRVLVVDGYGAIHEPAASFSPDRRSIGYTSLPPGSTSWAVQGSRQGDVYVIHPDAPDTRIRVG